MSVNTALVALLEALRVGLILAEAPSLEGLKEAVQPAVFGSAMIILAICKLCGREQQLYNAVEVLELLESFHKEPHVKMFTKIIKFVKDDNRIDNTIGLYKYVVAMDTILRVVFSSSMREVILPHAVLTWIESRVTWAAPQYLQIICFIISQTEKFDRSMFGQFTRRLGHSTILLIGTVVTLLLGFGVFSMTGNE